MSIDRSKWDLLVELARDAVDEAQSLESTFQEIESDMNRAKDGAINALEELQKMVNDAGLDVNLDLSYAYSNLRDLEQCVEEVESVDLESEEETITDA